MTASETTSNTALLATALGLSDDVDSSKTVAVCQSSGEERRSRRETNDNFAATYTFNQTKTTPEVASLIKIANDILGDNFAINFAVGGTTTAITAVPEPTAAPTASPTATPTASPTAATTKEKVRACESGLKNARKTYRTLRKAILAALKAKGK